MLYESQIKTYVVYTCSSGCGYVERARVWDSPPFGRDGELRCPDCGAQAWEHRGLSKREAVLVQDEGLARAERFWRY